MITATYDRIWRIVRRIPRGRVATYGQIARMVRVGPRQVGYALHNVPHGMELPWHRVINSQGRVSLPRAGGYERQKALLLKEGIRFNREKVDLQRYQWRTRVSSSSARP